MPTLHARSDQPFESGEYITMVEIEVLEHLECVWQSRSPVRFAKKLRRLRVGDIGLHVVL